MIQSKFGEEKFEESKFGEEKFDDEDEEDNGKENKPFKFEGPVKLEREGNLIQCVVSIQSMS